MQHDCSSSGCTKTTLQPVQQERLETSKVQRIMEHLDDGKYLLNVYVLHNHRYIRAATPEALRLRPTVVTDPARTQRLGAQKLRTKKTEDQQDIAQVSPGDLLGLTQATKEPSSASGLGAQDRDDDESRPAFDKPPKKVGSSRKKGTATKATTKAKGSGSRVPDLQGTPQLTPVANDTGIAGVAQSSARLTVCLYSHCLFNSSHSSS